MTKQPLHTTDRLHQLQATGVSIWLDSLSRDLLETGGFDRLQRERAVTGATSNPTIFAKAMAQSDRYDRQLAELLAAGVTDPHEQFLALALEDVTRAARSLRHVHRRSAGNDGFVSVEVTPDLAADSTATVAQAVELWQRLDAPNVMIKVPATEAGVDAIEQLTALGVNVNVTLLFAVERYEQVIDAYMSGIERRMAAGELVASIRSAASFFVSRVDAKADALLPAGSRAKGRVGIANARAAYETYRRAFEAPRWRRLAERGAAPQRPLWASTAPKDAAYPDVLYMESLALPDSIFTVPEPILDAFADHGKPQGAGRGSSEARHADEAAMTAVDLPAITDELEREGVQAFCDSYAELLGSLEERARTLGSTPVRVSSPAGEAHARRHRSLARRAVAGVADGVARRRFRARKGDRPAP